MFFWRKKNNQTEQDREAAEDKLIHKPDDPAIETVPELETVVDPVLTAHELQETEREIIETLEVIPVTHDAQQPPEKDDNGGGWLSRLTGGLTKTTGKIGGGIGDIFTKSKPDSVILDELEELLITADLGPQTAAKLVGTLKGMRFDKDNIAREVQHALSEQIALIINKTVKILDISKPENSPRVMLICGVNGVGKTTTIGKLAYQFHYRDHRKVMMAAGDTFRAAAIEQLQIWADRTKCPLVKSEIGGDSAALAFQAYEKAVAENIDILMIDTAGRLHNKANLMAELEKLTRVLKKKNESVPHEVILVLDATTGQNAIAQVETFKQIVNVTGLVVTKLDGSAKGGIVVALADKFGLPIYAVGVGEDIEDLQPFHPHEFAKVLIGIN